MGTININFTMPDDPKVEPLVFLDFDGTAFSFPLSGAKTLRDYLSQIIDEAQSAQGQRLKKAGDVHGT